ncbi:hypothetical protein F53441_3658 [Fusarium austroafricanum]|uniref:F-box domain-containing protein n=1 Tax=Fusarium austroafricanum TaxID=2364996 RepID=A0A8H4KQ30_9HYPO|nr:hypothetical protein F53441_3658 [Fusarium austroafricanum]
MLTFLPPEVIENICDKLNGIDLQQLSLTSKWLHRVTFRPLWRSVTIKPYPETERHCINPYGPLQPCLQFARELRFDPGDDVDPKRCIHARDWLGYMGSWVDKDPQQYDTWEARSDTFGLERGKLVRVKFECLAQRAVTLLRRLNDNQLESFSWNYTSCMPSEIFEILSLKHSSIQNLSFVTDPFCSRFNRWGRSSDLDLSAFRNLRRLSWRAPMGCHFDDIARLIQANAHQLEELDIELQSWSRDWENRESRVIHRVDDLEEWDKTPASTMLARQIFGLQATTSEVSERAYFPRLRKLRLTRVPLKDEITRKAVTAVSLNFDTLTSLTLRMCSYWIPLLSSIIESQIPLKLKTLEILDFYLKTPQITAVRNAAAIADFIDSFKGLEEIFISNSGPTSALEFWEHVTGHAETMKRLVYHQRIPDQDEETLQSRMGGDSSDLAISQADRDRIREDPDRNPLSRLDLEFIGLTCAPKYLRDILLPFASKSSLKVLHIRHTGVNSDPLPSWIFNHALELRISEAETNGVPINDTLKADRNLDDQAKEDVTVDLIEITTAVKERKDWKTPPLQQSFRDFANWIFGPEGIKSLEARGERRYRAVRQRCGGPEWLDVKSRFGSALEACPVENIVPEYN